MPNDIGCSSESSGFILIRFSQRKMNILCETFSHAFVQILRTQETLHPLYPRTQVSLTLGDAGIQ